MSFIVAIDGPSGSGKGTVTPALAEKFNLMYLDTGATYRCVTLKLLKENIAFDDIPSVQKALDEIKIEFKKIPKPKDCKDEHYEPKRVFLDGEDVTKEIREADVAKNVSPVSHIPEVRKAMVSLQRKMSEGKDVILEGRDIGTNVFPNADVKIYLDASFDERVRRRIKQNKEKGIEMSDEEVRKNMETRDYNDAHSDVGPLKQAEDAIYVDTTGKSIEKNISNLAKIIGDAKKKHIRIEDAYEMTPETTCKKVRRKLTKWFLAGLYHIFYRIRRSNMQVLNNRDEGYIITANHVNFIDAAAIILLHHRPIRFIAKADLNRIWILHHWSKMFNIIPVKRDTGDIGTVKLVLQGLKNKDVIGIFPEGTRKGMEKGKDIKNGAVYMAYKGKVKIVPVGIAGSFKPFTRVYVNYGEPIDVAKFKTDDPNWLDVATEEVMKQVVKLSDTTYYKNYKKAQREKKKAEKQK